ncbi:MAG: SRPBCC family protein [Phormidesmis sp.]
MNTPMSEPFVYQQSVFIRASATTVERCFTEQRLMHQWLNPALVCEPVGDWRTNVGSEFDFRLQVPVLPTALRPTLRSVVVERSPGRVVWGFDGFFRGRDRWECQIEGNDSAEDVSDFDRSPDAARPKAARPDAARLGTTLLNRFEFTIPNPLVSFGFRQFAASWTKQDMESQLQRLKQVAERL